MKKWAVGTEKPDVQGFRDVDELMARTPGRNIGAWRRFWFVPEDMELARTDDALIFKDARMTVQTEYMFGGKKGESSPADRAFASFFTDRYGEISLKYPVYSELYEYAKLVALAKFLKKNGIPMLWFLMANKDLILTEDSPSVVDELAKGSEYFAGVEITGGVDLVNEGRYIYDEEAVAAIAEAISKLPASALSAGDTFAEKRTTQSVFGPFSFDYRETNYSVLPQHSLTSGKDRRGVRYQTDLAFWEDEQPGLELVRCYDARRPKGGEFGNGWRLLIPYRIAPADSAKREFLNAVIPVQMAVENLMSGDREVLTFSTDRYSIAGYVPDDLEYSQVVGLFIMSDASYRLADKLGNQFWFDASGFMTDMFFFSDTNHVHLEYIDGFIDEFSAAPYEIQPRGDELVGFLNAEIPKAMNIVDLGTGEGEVLVFSDTGAGDFAGYTPKDTSCSRFVVMALLSDASFQLLDKKGNEFGFDQSGQFTGMLPSTEGIRPLESMSRGGIRLTFEYEFDRDNSVRISRAKVYHRRKRRPGTDIVYSYDAEGRLCHVVGPATRTAGLD